MSNINPSTISTTFPIAGQDNSTAGFRSNFAAIQNNLTTAYNEISALQQVGIVSADLATQTTPVVNNLQGSTISNGLYQLFSGTLKSTPAASGTVNVDLSQGAVQSFVLTGNTTFTFATSGSTTGWPTYSGKSVYTNAILFLRSDGNGVWTPTFGTLGGGTVVYDVNFPTIPATGVQGVTVGGECVTSVSVGSGNAGSGYTSATVVGFTGGSPQTNSITPTATATYTAVGTGFSALVRPTTTGTPNYTVTGYNTIATTATTGTGGTATLTFAAQPVAPYAVGSTIWVQGVTPAGYNGVYTVTACTTTSVSYANTTTASQTVAGTITTGWPGNNYAVGDLVTLAGHSDAVFSVTSLATYFTGTIANGSPTINNVYNFTNLTVGMTVTASGIPANTTISTINLGFPGSIQLSANATASATTTINYVSTTGPIATLSTTPTGTFTAPLVGLWNIVTMTGIGSGARALINNGVGAVNVTNKGDGYTTVAPTVTFTSGGGSGTTATAVLTSNTSSRYQAIEAWTVDGGATVYLRYLGQY